MECQKQGHVVYHTRYHVVIVTKYRRKVLKGGLVDFLKITLREMSRYYPDIQILEVNTDEDHVHLLVSIPPTMAVSHAIRLIKANTGRALREKFPFLQKVYWGVPGVWSIGHFVSTVGINESVIRKYIERQGQEDSGQAKLEF